MFDENMVGNVLISTLQITDMADSPELLIITGEPHITLVLCVLDTEETYISKYGLVLT